MEKVGFELWLRLMEQDAEPDRSDEHPAIDQDAMEGAPVHEFRKERLHSTLEGHVGQIQLQADGAEKAQKPVQPVRLQYLQQHRQQDAQGKASGIVPQPTGDGVRHEGRRHAPRLGADRGR